MGGMSYNELMDRKNEIMKKALGIDYEEFEEEGIAFDYEKMMEQGAYPLDKIREIQRNTKVGNTPLFELKNLNKAIKKLSPPGKGARVFLKDEAANASGSFKARRASVSAYHAEEL